MSTFLTSDCATTLSGTPAEKKRNTITGKKSPSIYAPRPKLVEDYHNVPETDIINHNSPFLNGLEGSIRTRNVNIRMATTNLSTWMTNGYGMTMKFLPYHKNVYHYSKLCQGCNSWWFISSECRGQRQYCSIIKSGQILYFIYCQQSRCSRKTPTNNSCSCCW